MHRAIAFVFSLLLLACAASFASSSNDPRIIIKDPVCGSNCVSVGKHFSYYSPVSGSGVLFFLNASGVDWTKLLLIESGVAANQISCQAPETFAHCSVTTRNGITEILLTGVGESFSGISAGGSFSIGFKSWPQGGVFFMASANAPEPWTGLLFLTGLVGLLACRRRLCI